MAKRGRRSQASLTPLPTPAAALPQRPAPPPELGEDGGRRWSEIVDALPADYWRPSDLRLLGDMIVCERYVHECDEIIVRESHVVSGATGALVTNPAVTARKGYLATIIMIQRALRLPPSTRYDKKAAKLGQTAGKRPWQA